MTPKTMILLGAALLIGAPSAAMAQGQGATGPEKINQVIVYGDDPCPTSSGEEIVVCARKDEAERFRIPENLRGENGGPGSQAWAEKAKAIEYVGRSGTESCSPVGGGGFTGCFNQIMRNARAERQLADDMNWNDLVAAERAKRLSTIDADSKAIDASVTAEEKAQAGDTKPGVVSDLP